MPMLIKNKLSSGAPTSSLRYHLHKHLAGYRRARSHKQLHASDGDPGRPEFCPRAFALMDLTGRKPRDEFIPTSMQVTFDQGHRTADLVIDYFAEMGRAVGHWVCRSCRHEHPFTKRPKACKQCGCTVFRYREVFFRAPQYGITSSVDLLVDMGGPKLRAVEIKSVIEHKYKTLIAPTPEHRWRSVLYLRMMGETTNGFVRDRVDRSKMTVLYVAKGGYGAKDDKVKTWGLMDYAFSPFKEYDVHAGDADVEGYLLKAQALEDWRRRGGGMPGGVCPNSFCQRAKECEVIAPCFSGKYPSGAPIPSGYEAENQEV